MKRLMFEKDIRITELARRIKRSQATVHRIANGISTRPHADSLEPIAEYFSITLEQLKGEQPIPWLDSYNTESQSKAYTEVPLINWEDATRWPETKQKQTSRYVISDVKNISASSFALEIKDEAMSPQFPKGSIIIVDPTIREVKDRQLVVARIANFDKAVFRLLLVDATQRYLKTLSPDLDAFKMIHLTQNDKILGIVVQARMDFI